MGKLVVLELEGDLHTLGFRVTLEIKLEGELQVIKINGRLPPSPALAIHLQHHWQENYRSLIAPSRIENGKITYGSINQRIAECKESAQKLRDQLRKWLNADLFRDVDRRLREELNRDEAIRLLIRSEDRQLQKLPWQEWDFFERYPKAEVAFSATEFERRQKSTAPILRKKVRILAILGNSNGINTEVDRRKLEALPNAEVKFLVEPERQQLNHQLWEQPWDILFFAGHSRTCGEFGRISINHTDSLSISELKYGLTKAIAQGLQLAIFNSCDGLGLAYELEQLHIPQMIVMREPVPDRVAQEFIHHFLTAFAAGDSFYLAERQARERLQGLENEFPCASWLPVIYQNPVEAPPDWLLLQGQSKRQVSSQQRDKVSHLADTDSTQPPSNIKRLSLVFLASVAVTSLVMGVRYLGILEPLELLAYNHLVQRRPLEPIDKRILVVEVTQEDVAEHQYPLEDAVVAQLLKKLEQYKPRVLGLDMHRYQSRGAGRKELISLFKANQNLFIVCASGSSDPNYGPPLEFSEKQLRNQVGFSDLAVDSSNHQGTVRRQLLSYDPSLSPSLSSCSTPYSFSFQLAFRFLYEAGIQPMKVTEDTEWQFGRVTFKPLASHFGGYQALDGLSSQIMLNYRSNQPAQRVTLKRVLLGQVDPSLIKNQVVIIGYTAPIARDNFDTPYGEMAGIWVHAHMVSQILSAAMEKRPLIWSLSQWGDTLWVFGWSITSGLLALGLRTRPLLYLGLAASTVFGLYQICLLILIQGGWMPFIPSALSLTGSILVIYQASHTENSKSR